MNSPISETSQQMLARGGQAAAVKHVASADVLTPADRYQELFVAVQTGGVFADSKSFVDCVPRQAPEAILREYRAAQDQEGFDLAAFVAAQFRHEAVAQSSYVSDPEQALVPHIDGLWDVLTRHPGEHLGDSSLLPLPHDYVVPGGRFGELYYWDSYFTMLGLAESGRSGLLRAMADNFAFLIDHYGHIPNGNRSYYLSRSQPPVFALMVDLFETHGIKRAVHFLPQLRREYAYWMDGAERIAAGEAWRQLVRLPDGSLLNRYWDDRDTPREESYLEDLATARLSTRPAAEVCRDLRAGAASGWDFSSRWLAEPDDLSSIRTTAILPVDLNAFLHKLESQIARLASAAGEVELAATFAQHAQRRREAMDRYLWSASRACWLDYDWRLAQPRAALNAAMVVPLYVGMASPAQAHGVAEAIRAHLLAAGGIATTEQGSAQQWDRPNGWAPLQWMAIRGLRRYGQRALANEIAHRWLETVAGLYRREGKLVEKYALSQAAEQAEGGAGGEYPLQDGFGWTNGVTRKLLHEDPAHASHGAKAHRPRRALAR